MPHHSLRATLGTVLALAAAVPAAAQGQPPGAERPFAERERVTAVDVVVEVKRTLGPTAGAPLPDTLAPADFEVVVDGRTLPVVTIERPGGDAEPWNLVVWFDLPLLSPEEVATVVEALKQAGHVVVNGKKVAYPERG